MWQDEEGELLNAWRDATRAAELAQRLATSAADALARADVQATESAEIARLAEQAADAAGRAADRARTVATEAARHAQELRERDVLASHDMGDMRSREELAGDAYHRAKAEREGNDQAS